MENFRFILCNFLTGAAVVLWDVNKAGLEKVEQEIIDKGGHAFAYFCNLRDKHDIQRTAAKVSKEVGNPTILVNNAGIVAGKFLLDLNENEIEAAYDVNILAHFWVCYDFHLYLLEILKYLKMKV